MDDTHARNWCGSAYDMLSDWYRHGAGDVEARQIFRELTGLPVVALCTDCGQEVEVTSAICDDCRVAPRRGG